MELNQLKALISSAFPQANIEVTGDGRHFEATVISNEFDGLNSFKRQRKVHACMHDDITSGAIHAINIHAYTEQEWQQK